MLQTIPIYQIKERADVIRLSLRRLALGTTVSPSVAYGGATGKHETRRSKEAELGGALVVEELRLLRHLAALHPQTAIEAATVALCPEKRSAA